MVQESKQPKNSERDIQAEIAQIDQQMSMTRNQKARYYQRRGHSAENSTVLDQNDLFIPKKV